MTLSDKQKIFGLNVAKLIEHIYSQGYSISFGEAFRTQEQADIYAKDGKGIKNSLHCERLAVDLNIFDKDGKFLNTVADYRPFGEYWSTLHPYNRWGGCEAFIKCGRPDSDHFEMQNL
jgi:hypothetical protein